MKFKQLLPAGCMALICGVTASAQDSAPVNVLLGKTVVEVAGKPAADSEGPEKLIDGDLTTKYCIIQSSPFIVIDAEGYFDFTGFKFYDCKTNEDEENASAYTLQLSMDGKNWETAAEANGVADIDLKEINLATPVKARFVRFAPTYNNCARMWELEGYGTDATTIKAELKSDAAIELNAGDKAEIKVSYTLTGDKASDFACIATCEKSNVEAGTPAEADGVFTIPVTAVSKGTAKVEVKIVNDGEIVTFIIPVKVKSSEAATTDDAVKITNWGEDFLAEKLSGSAYTSGYNSSSWDFSKKVFYSSAVAEEGALCDEDGIVEVPTSGNVYVIPVAENNAKKIERYANPFELLFADPIPTESVNLLVFAASKTMTLKAILNYDDNSESDPVTKGIGAWNGETDGHEAITGLGVVEYDAYDAEDYIVADNKNYRVYEMEIPADQYKNVKSISLTTEGGDFNSYSYVIGVNAHNVNGQVVKHLTASLVASSVKVKAGSTAEIIVNYALTDVEGMTDELEYSAEPSKDAITLGEIKHDKDAHTLTIPVNGVNPAMATVEISVSFAGQVIKLVADVLVKSTVSANTADCVEVSNWKHDIIAEAQPADQYTDEKLDEQGWVFFTDDIHPEGAIAGDERLIVANSGNVYQLAAYNEKNGTVFVGNDSFDFKDDIEFATPFSTDKINLLGISANGISNLQITVNYTDGTKADAQSALVADWYSARPDGDEAVYGLGRLHRTNHDIAGERFFRLYEIPITADKARDVKSLTVRNRANGTYFTAVGINAANKETSGIGAIEAGNAGKTIEAVYNLCGQKVEDPESGIYVVRYSDGTCDKIIVK